MKKVLMILVVLWAMVIFYLSSQNAEQSNGASTFVIETIIDGVIGLTNREVTVSQRGELIRLVNGILREYMHGVVFLFLGGFLQLFNELYVHKKPWIVWVICIIYGISDEIHQLFVPGRAFQISDLMMDAIGSLLGIGLVYLCAKALQKRQIMRK